MGDMQYRFFDAHLHLQVGCLRAKEQLPTRGFLTVAMLALPFTLQDERVRGLATQLISEAQSVGVEHLACNGCSQHDWSEVRTLCTLLHSMAQWEDASRLI